MELHWYETHFWSKEPKIYHGVIEVNETKKQYRVINNMQTSGWYPRSILNRSDEGKLLPGDFVFLKERNDDYIKELFVRRKEQDVEAARQELQKEEKKLEAIKTYSVVEHEE